MTDVKTKIISSFLITVGAIVIALSVCSGPAEALANDVVANVQNCVTTVVEAAENAQEAQVIEAIEQSETAIESNAVDTETAVVVDDVEADAIVVENNNAVEENLVTETTEQDQREAAINAYIAEAEKMAENDTIGYSQANRCLNSGVDCSSYIYYSVLKSDTSTTSELGESPFTTYTMGARLMAAGFSQYSYSSVADELQPGDILVKAEHTEMVFDVETMSTIGAHKDYDGVAGDSTGREVCESIGNAANSSWLYVYRLDGMNTSINDGYIAQTAKTEVTADTANEAQVETEVTTPAKTETKVAETSSKAQDCAKATTQVTSEKKVEKSETKAPVEKSTTQVSTVTTQSVETAEQATQAA